MGSFYKELPATFLIVTNLPVDKVVLGGKGYVVKPNQRASRIWKKQFGESCEKAQDFAGRTIIKSQFNSPELQGGWNIDHIQPKSKGGSDKDINLCCVNIVTNQEKADDFPKFIANGKQFKVITENNKPKVITFRELPYYPRPTIYDSPSQFLEQPYDYLDHLKQSHYFMKEDLGMSVAYIRVRIRMGDNACDGGFIRCFRSFLTELLKTQSIDIRIDTNEDRQSREIQCLVLVFNIRTSADFDGLLMRLITLNTWAQYFQRVFNCEFKILANRCYHNCHLSQVDFISRLSLASRDCEGSEEPYIQTSDYIFLSKDFDQLANLALGSALVDVQGGTIPEAYHLGNQLALGRSAAEADYVEFDLIYEELLELLLSDPHNIFNK